MGNTRVIRLDLRDQRDLAAGLASFLRAGLTLSESLAGTAEISRRSTVREVARHILAHVVDGTALESAITTAIANPDPFLRAMASVADETGAAADAFSRTEEHLADRVLVSDSVRAASVYPAFVVFLTIVGAVLIGLVVAPRVGTVLSESGLLGAEDAAHLTDTGRTFVGFLGAGVLGICLAVAAFVGLPRVFRLPESAAVRLARIRAAVPLVGRIETARDLLTIAEATRSMAESGIAIDRALERAAACVGNRWTSVRLLDAARTVRDGGTFVEAMETGVAGSSVIAPWLRRVERGADLIDSLGSMSRFLRETRHRSVNRIIAVSEPALTVFAGGVLFCTVLFLVRPLFQLYSVVVP